MTVTNEQWLDLITILYPKVEDALAQGCWPAPEVPVNVNTKEMGKLQLTDAQENAIVAFLKTLSDGYQQ